MSSINKPLSYASLNCVIKRFDANTRIMLLLLEPRLAPIDKKYPLKIDKLCIDNTALFIDGITYQTGLIATCTTGPTDQSVNPIGGTQWTTGSKVVKPGDIVVSEYDPKDCLQLIWNLADQVEKVRFVFMKAIETFLDSTDPAAINPLEFFTCHESHSVILRRLDEIFGNDFSDVFYRTSGNRFDLQSVNHLALQFPRAYRKMLEKAEIINRDQKGSCHKLLGFLTWPQHRYDTENWFTVYQDSAYPAHSVLFSRKLPIKVRDGFKKLADRILGGRPSIMINKLNSSAHSGIVGLPPGLKISFRTIGYYDENFFDAFDPIFDDFQLEHFEYPYFPMEIHEKIRSCKSVHVKFYFELDESECEDVAELTNHHVYVDYKHKWGGKPGYCVEVWRRNTEREIGSTCTITGGGTREQMKSFLEYMCQDHEDTRMGQLVGREEEPIDCLILPMTRTKELVVYGLFKPGWDRCDIRMEVMPVGVAVPNKQ